MGELAYYTDVSCIGNKLYMRGLDDQYQEVNLVKTDFQPSTWVPITFNYKPWYRSIVEVTTRQYTDLVSGEPLVKLKFDNISNCKKFIWSNTNLVKESLVEGKPNTQVYTTPSNSFVSEFLQESFPENLRPPVQKFRIYAYDIETETGHRDVLESSLVRVKKKTESNSMIESDSQEKTVTVEEFESFSNRTQWEILDESTGIWVDYEHHPYRFKGGFPEPRLANEKITLITIKDINQNQTYTWGNWEFSNLSPRITYFQCKDEKTLLSSFLDFFEAHYPHIITGWNTSDFDNPYLYNRIKKVLGVGEADRLSPYHKVTSREIVNDYGRKQLVVNWEGIADLDYLRLYKKFTYGNRESYKLDSVAEDEVGYNKVPNPTGGNFRDFYTGVFDVSEKPSEDEDIIKRLGYIRTQLKLKKNKTPEEVDKLNYLNNKIIQLCHQRFIEYNINDVSLVDKIDNKQRFINLITTIAYMAHCNFTDVFSPVKTWDYIIYNKSICNNQVIPRKRYGVKSEKYIGAYVKPPLIGKHEYCESFDLDSLYPHLIMQYNIGPETIIHDHPDHTLKLPVSLDKLVHKTENTQFAHERNYSLGANGVCFSKDKQSILSMLCNELYASRKENKKKMLKFKSTLVQVQEEMNHRGLASFHH